MQLPPAHFRISLEPRAIPNFKVLAFLDIKTWMLLGPKLASVVDTQWERKSHRTLRYLREVLKKNAKPNNLKQALVFGVWWWSGD